MPRVCTVCVHPDRAAIERQLVAGTPYRHIASQFGVSYKAAERHKDAHISAAIAQAQDAREAAQALDVVKQLKAINGAALEILRQARQRGEPDVALRAIDRIQRQIELQAKLLGELDERPQLNVLLADPQWLAIFAAIRRVLMRYPGALEEVDVAVAQLEDADGGGKRAAS